MHDDVYRDLPRELTALLRDPRIVLPGELETMDRINAWVQAPTFSNTTIGPLPSYVSAHPEAVDRATTGTSG